MTIRRTSHDTICCYRAAHENRDESDLEPSGEEIEAMVIRDYCVGRKAGWR